jgi:hypothetical protein
MASHLFFGGLGGWTAAAIRKAKNNPKNRKGSQASAGQDGQK